MNEEQIQPYAAAIRKLLRGVVYYDDTRIWQQLRDHELPIREYLGAIGLQVLLDETGGFAYLHDISADEDGPASLPRLTMRRELNFMDTLLLVLLRERYDEHEGRNMDMGPLSLSAEDLLEMVQVFMPDLSDARKLESSTAASIKRLVRYGFLSERRGGGFIVRPVIRQKVSAGELASIKARLTAYVSADAPEGAEESGVNDEE